MAPTYWLDTKNGISHLVNIQTPQNELTSINDLQNAPGSGGLGILGELIIGAIGALVVLVLVFGSFLAVVPLIVAAVSILGTFLLLGAIMQAGMVVARADDPVAAKQAMAESFALLVSSL